MHTIEKHFIVSKFLCFDFPSIPVLKTMPGIVLFPVLLNLTELLEKIVEQRQCTEDVTQTPCATEEDPGSQADCPWMNR